MDDFANWNYDFTYNNELFQFDPMSAGSTYEYNQQAHVDIPSVSTMNNFPIESSTDLFGNGILGSCSGLFDSQLNYMSDMSSFIHDVQPHAIYYSTDLRDDFHTLTSVASNPAFDFGQPTTAIGGLEALTYDSGTTALVTENSAAIFSESESFVGTCDAPTTVETENPAASTVTETEVTAESAVAEVTDVAYVEGPGDEYVVTEDMAETAEVDEDATIDIAISNVVCSFTTKCYLNLRKVALNAFNVEYKKATGTILMKLKKPNITANIWASGKVTCTGARSEEEARIGARRVARCLQKIYETAKFCEFRIVNVLGTCSLPFGIRINEFSPRYKEAASYEPEIHPGVTYKITSPKATLKIFSTGSITVTAPRISNIQRAIEHIYPLVVEFRMDKNKAEQLDPWSAKFATRSDQFVKRSNTGEWIQKPKRARCDGNASDSSEDNAEVC